MKTIKSIGDVSAQDKKVSFELVLSDGSKEAFVCKTSDLTDLIVRLSQVTFAIGDDSGQLSPEHKIGYEAGTGRVWLRLGIPGGKSIEMIMGHARALALGNGLVDAAEKSTVPVSHH